MTHKDRHKSQREKSRSRSQSSSQHRTSHEDRHKSQREGHDPDCDPVHRIKGIVLPDQDLGLKFQHHHRVDSQYCQGYHTHLHHGGL